MSSIAPRFENVVIRASAGTGKTFQLSNRFLALAAAGELFDSILATTFTRKAAGEILDRVILRVAEAALDETRRVELAGFLGRPDLDRPRCLAILQMMLRQLHRLRVATLDSFFIDMARSFSLELGLPPAWQVVDELVDIRLQNEAIREVLQKQSTADTVRLMHMLGKGEISRSVSSQMQSLVRQLHAIYAETPAEAWDALPRPMRLAPEELRTTLFDLAEAELPNDKRFIKARDEDMERFRSEQWEAFIAKGLATKVLDGSEKYWGKPIPLGTVVLYKKLLTHVRAVVLGTVANQTKATGDLLARFDEAYDRLKTARRALRFDDVTRRLGEAWGDGRLDKIAYRLDARIAHLLLDEFQDTAPSQWRVLRPLARQVVAGGHGHSFFCVGDVKQAIYGWRGGVAEIFEAIHQELKPLVSDSLEESFRSAPPVIDTVNRVFEDLANNAVLGRYPEARKCWAARFIRHRTARTELGGYCSLQTAPQADEDQKQDHVTLAFAADRIVDWLRASPGATVGVLVRKNATVARMIHELRRRGIEASEEGGNPLADSPAVSLILSLLVLADHPGDRAARFHVARSPLGGAVGLARHDETPAAWRLSAELRRQLLAEGYGQTLDQWTRLLASQVDARELGRLAQLVELGYAHQIAPDSRVDDFIEVVRHQRVQDPTSADVRVMTVHQAKGLQFDIVVLPELDARLTGQPGQLAVSRAGPTSPVERVCRYVSQTSRPLFPPAVVEMFSAHERRVVEESLCVLYVALTRAVHSLHIVINPPRANEKTIPATLAGVVRIALVGTQPIEPETVLYETGDADWACHGQPAPVTPPTAPEPLVLRLAPSTNGVTRGLERVTPSELEGGSKVDLAQRLRFDTADARRRGTLVHAWFEQIAWLDDGTPDDDALRRVADMRGEELADLDELIGRFRAALQRPTIAAVLRRESYRRPSEGVPQSAADAAPAIADPRWELFRERVFAVRAGDSIISGSIDRLVVLYNGPKAVGADVLDFKSDLLPDDDPGAIDQRVEFYRPQMESYRHAVAVMYRLPVERISARLVFITPGVVRTV